MYHNHVNMCDGKHKHDMTIINIYYVFCNICTCSTLVALE